MLNFMKALVNDRLFDSDLLQRLFLFYYREGEHNLIHNKNVLGLLQTFNC